MAKKKTAKQQKPPEVPFEESLSELQQIVAQLESGSLGLEESMRRFEAGVQLLRGCYQVLAEAEQKIEILTGFDEQGNPLTAAFDASATVDQQEKTAGRRSSSRAKDRETAKPTSPSCDEDEVESDEENEGLDSLF